MSCDEFSFLLSRLVFFMVVLVVVYTFIALFLFFSAKFLLSFIMTPRHRERHHLNTTAGRYCRDGSTVAICDHYSSQLFSHH